jgi:aminopeptidase N
MPGRTRLISIFVLRSPSPRSGNLLLFHTRLQLRSIALSARSKTPTPLRPFSNLNLPGQVAPGTARALSSMSPSRSDRDVLPDAVKPINYDLSLYDLEFGGAFSYQGTVAILAKIVRSTNEIILNTHQLIIHSAEVSVEQAKSQQSFISTDISLDAARRRATILFPTNLPVSDRALITLKFQGTINHDMAGFSRAKYKPTVTPAASVPMEGEHHLMFSTQFEACDARRAFPCFDEPNLKATFDFEIEIPSDLVALSNMPEKGIRKTKDGFHAVSFERTPVMSTYLLAWAVGDFEYIEDFTKRKYNGKALPVRVYTTRGLKHQAQYALDHAPRVIDYFSDIFGIDYPLPKSDLLAVHEFVSDLTLLKLFPSIDFLSFTSWLLSEIASSKMIF